MDFVIALLQRYELEISRNVKNSNLMQTDMRTSSLELAKVNELKKANKKLKTTNRKRL